MDPLEKELDFKKNCIGRFLRLNLQDNGPSVRYSPMIEINKGLKKFFEGLYQIRLDMLKVLRLDMFKVLFDK